MVSIATSRLLARPEVILMRLGRDHARATLACDFARVQLTDEYIRYWIGFADPTGERDAELLALVERGRNVVRRFYVAAPTPPAPRDPLETALAEAHRIAERIDANRPTGTSPTSPWEPSPGINVPGMVALAYGILRAVYECPECPGHFRVPYGEGATLEDGPIICPNCHVIWKRKPDEPTPIKPKRARKKAQVKP